MLWDFLLGTLFHLFLKNSKDFLFRGSFVSFIFSSFCRLHLLSLILFAMSLTFGPSCSCSSSRISFTFVVLFVLPVLFSSRLLFPMSLLLVPIDKPVINPFLFGSNLKEGMRTSVLCSVTSGESPLTITWFKNHDLLQTAHPEIEILSLGDFTSTVRINSVRRDHSGNYTCQAKSFKGSPASFTAEMVVQGMLLLKFKEDFWLSSFCTHFCEQSHINLNVSIISSDKREFMLRWKIFFNVSPFPEFDVGFIFRLSLEEKHLEFTETSVEVT